MAGHCNIGGTIIWCCTVQFDKNFTQATCFIAITTDKLTFYTCATYYNIITNIISYLNIIMIIIYSLRLSRVIRGLFGPHRGHRYYKIGAAIVYILCFLFKLLQSPVRSTVRFVRAANFTIIIILLYTLHNLI